MRVKIDEAMAYIRENFNISGEAQRMAENLLEYANTYRTTNAIVLVLDVLGGFGFERSDLDALVEMGAVVENE